MVMVFGNRYPCFAVQDGQDMTWVHSMSTCRVQDHVLSMYSSICSANTRLWIPIMILSICSKSEESRVSQGEPGWARLSTSRAKNPLWVHTREYMLTRVYAHGFTNFMNTKVSICSEIGAYAHWITVARFLWMTSNISVFATVSQN